MRRRSTKLVLWSAGAISALGLALWLAFFLLSNTTVRVDGRGPAAETAVGNLSCRKTLSGTFPFFTLTCRER